MLRIKCPYCGIRDQTEFRYGGEANRIRPSHAEQLSDAEWAAYLFNRENPKGALRERWVHSYGCRQWFIVVRDTVTHDMLESSPVSAPRQTGGDDSTSDAGGEFA
jgi:heterotetrameric sarcosine oxidase delta subunit